MTSAEKQQAGMLTLEQAARLLMISKERVRQLVASGHIPKADRNAYPIIGTVQGYLRAKEEELRRVRDEASANGLRSARQAEIEMRMAERRRELISKSAAYAAMDELVGEINKGFSGFAARVTRDPALRRVIDQHLDVTLNCIADKCSDEKDGLVEGKEPHR